MRRLKAIESVIAPSDPLRVAECDHEAMARTTSTELARFALRPMSPDMQAAGLAAYTVWLADLYGWNDRDRLHLS